MMPFQICTRDSFLPPSPLSLFLSHPLSLLLTPRSTYASEETGVLARGWPELRHLRVISFLLLPFVMH